MFTVAQDEHGGMVSSVLSFMEYALTAELQAK